MKPVLLCILDGVGMRKESHGNAFLQAKTPNFDQLWKEYPHSYLQASGIHVGLPAGQMGNSEVGHLNIGAGRIVYQPLQFISQKIKDNTFFQNEKMLEVIKHVKKNNSRLQIFGLLSDGGIHSHTGHLMAIIDLCKKEDMKNVYFHIFTDGRDTLTNVALTYLDQLQKKIEETGIGKIATISGRYYAMDRDNRYDRIQKAYNAIVKGQGETYNTYQEAIEHNYQNNITDEFIVPAVLDKDGYVKKGDGLLVFNYRPDRLRELFSALTNPKFKGFKRKWIPNLKLVTMMPVSDEVIYEPAFTNEKLENTLGEYVSKQGFKQLRIAETEKYAHVTYFFDGGEEKKLTNCERILIPSPKVATYDLSPAMSAVEITDTLLSKLNEDIYDLIILNFANGDMLGHTGNLEAAIESLEIVDTCLGKLYHKIQEKNGTLIVTADHGNCEIMLDDNNNKITSHTTSLVPFIVTQKNITLEDGKLSDIAPTILSILDLEIPPEMEGKNLITIQKKTKTKDKKSKKASFYFFIISFLFLGSLLGIYGYRLLHYYQLSHNHQIEIVRLHDQIVANTKPVTSGDGLYYDFNQNQYIYKGKVENNYVYYSGRYFRIVRINADGSIVLITDQNETSMVWNYKNNEYENSYIRDWLNPSEKEYTGIFYHSLENPDLYLQTNDYCIDKVDGKTLTCDKTVSDKVGLLSIKEYQDALAYNSYLNIGAYWWTSNASLDDHVWYVFSEGGINSKSSTYEAYNAYGVRPVITLKPDVNFVSGTGTKNDPYRITNTNLTFQIGNYIEFDDALWRIIAINENDIRIMKNDVLKINEETVKRLFSNHSNQYNPNEKGSLAYYLNHTYFEKLQNNHLLVDALWYNGTYGEQYDYRDIYKNQVEAKVGLISVSDFHGNTTESFVTATGMYDDLIYYVSEHGSLSTIDIQTEFAVKPVLALTKSITIIDGTGLEENPYKIG